MTPPTESQWVRYSALCARLRPLPLSARQAALQALRATRDEDPQVLSLVAFHFALPPDPLRNRTGERLGNFTLAEPLGAGGMGVVYRAQQHLGAATRPVAVKLLHPTLLLAAQEEALTRFLAEVHTLGTLQHEGIARLYDGGITDDPHTHDPLPYLAMELVPGGLPLTTYAREYALPWQERLALFVRVCQAVRYAHEHRVVHRDLKPANILVDHDGRPVVIDFGLAAACDVLLPGAPLAASGTPAYMSPEQVSAVWGTVSDRSDVYALGLILYELLTGELPYTLPPTWSWEQLRDVIATATPRPLGQHRPEYDGELDALVTGALAKRPADRCSVAVLRTRLERALHVEGTRMGGVHASLAPLMPPGPALHQVPAPPLRRRGAAMWPKVAFGLVGLLLLFEGGVASWQRFLPALPTTVAPAQQTAVLALPDRPSIAVLPLVNLSGDPAQEYFSDGMTEDLTTELSRIAGLFVIAYNSTRIYKGKAVQTAQVSRELGVRYVLDGSVRRADERVRVTVRLVDTRTGYHLWAERYDGALQELFSLQDAITQKIVTSLAVKLHEREDRPMSHRYTSNTQAWDYYVRARELFRQATKTANQQARALLEQAIALDPRFARAYATLAATHRRDWVLAWSEDLEASETFALTQAQRAVALDTTLPHGYKQLAYIYVYQRQHEQAIAQAHKAVTLDTNDADSYAVLAEVLNYAGQYEQAIEHIQMAIRLDPYHSAHYPYVLGQAYYLQKEYQKAEEALTHSFSRNPKFLAARAYRAAVYMELGLQTLARQEMEVVRQGIPTPARERKSSAPFKDPAITEYLRDLWRRAEGGTERP